MAQPKVNSEGAKELAKLEGEAQKLENSFREFDPFKGIQDAPLVEPQTKMSTREANSADAIWVKPIRSQARPNFKNDKIDSRVYFDEKFRQQHDDDWRYVKCIVENNELIGEDIEVWTGKWGCDPAHFWRIPVNKPVMIPKLLAEQLSKCKYHRLRMENGAEKNYFTRADGSPAAMVADQVIRRIDARPVGFGFV